MRAAIVTAILLATAPVAAQDVPAKIESGATADRIAPDQVRCVRIGETGSRVRSSKVCKTNAEWNRLAEAGNQQAADIVDAARRVSEQGN